MYHDRKQRLLDIVWAMVNAAPSWDAEPVTVTQESAATAERFLKSLPSNRELPKVAPDGEGNILFVWEPPQGNCIVTVEPDVLHLVDQPGTRHAAHIDAQEFTSRRIPLTVLTVIAIGHEGN